MFQQKLLYCLLDPRAVKVDEVEFCEECEELMIFGARRSDRCATKNGIVPKHKPGSFEQKGLGIRVRFSRVIEVRPVLDADTGLNQSLDYDFRLRGNLEIYRLAWDQLNSLLLQTSGEVVFIHSIGVCCCSGNDHGLADTDGDRHGQRSALFFGLGKLLRQVASWRSTHRRLLGT